MKVTFKKIKGRHRNGIFGLLTLSVFLVFLPVSFTHSSDLQDSEREVKAAFIHHFCAYVTWPQTPENAQYVVGVAASNKTTRLVKQRLEEKLNGICQLRVRVVRPEDDLRDIHILYVTRDANLPLANFRALAQNPAILTISEEGNIPQRGMINFVIHDNYVRFQISKSRAEETGLRMSSQLLEVAVQVH